MNFRRILSFALTAILLPVIPCVNAADLFNSSYDMRNVKADAKNGVILEQDVPDGDYIVTVKTGGDTATKANIYINGGERVREYTLEAGKTQDNEQPVVPKDGKITIQILGENPNVTEIDIKQLPNRTEPGEKTTLYIAGDSTAQTYDYTKVYPQTGWGQELADLTNENLVVENRAMGGRSSKSYNNDGRLDKILTEMHPGDYVFIQFGINDGAENKPERYISVPDYKELIKTKYIGEVRKRGGIPVLLTPTAAAWWDEEKNEFMQSRQDYAVPTKEVAEETDTILLDINDSMTNMWNTKSKEEVFNKYFICEPLESKAYPAGTDDHTHLRADGARSIAGLIAELANLKIPGFNMYLEDFNDVQGHWGRQFITDAFLNNGFNGYGDGTFRPDNTITRGEFLKVIMDAARIHGHAYRSTEDLDANETDWYCYYLQGAADKGIVPCDMINSAGMQDEIVTIQEATEDKEAVTAVVKKYIPNSGGMDFDGDKPITREEMAVLTANCLKYIGYDKTGKSVNFADEDKISSKYVENVKYVSECGILEGDDDLNFNPQNNMTRAEAARVSVSVSKAVSEFEEKGNL